mmetsp:Transcript_24599/g.49016  ORF Transcript_24599/g.49016 Transcript_24599/m.49016 type:complete len:339 (+) Transcript_24599:536-1552(+)
MPLRRSYESGIESSGRWLRIESLRMDGNARMRKARKEEGWWTDPSCSEPSTITTTARITGMRLFVFGGSPIWSFWSFCTSAFPAATRTRVATRMSSWTIPIPPVAATAFAEPRKATPATIAMRWPMATTAALENATQIIATAVPAAGTNWRIQCTKGPWKEKASMACNCSISLANSTTPSMAIRMTMAYFGEEVIGFRKKKPSSTTTSWRVSRLDMATTTAAPCQITPRPARWPYSSSTFVPTKPLGPPKEATTPVARTALPPNPPRLAPPPSHHPPEISSGNINGIGFAPLSAVPAPPSTSFSPGCKSIRIDSPTMEISSKSGVNSPRRKRCFTTFF